MAQTYDEYDDWEEEGKDSPLALVGILVMALTSAAIMGNALFMQPKSAEIELITQASKQQNTELSTGNIAVKTPVAKTPPAPAPSAVQNDRTSMTLAIQRQLTMSGYYVGPLDGKEGEQTREAILAYQDAMGMPTTGAVSIELHDILTGRKSYEGARTNAVKSLIMPSEPTPSVPQDAEQQADASLDQLPRIKPALPAPSSRSSTNARLQVKPQTPPAQVDLTGTAVQPTQQQMARGLVPPESIPTASASASAAGDPTLAKVQSALKRFGYNNLTVDGLMGSNTKSAIADFQRSRGHPVTGTVNDRLLQEMMIMGYLDLG